MPILLAAGSTHMLSLVVIERAMYSEYHQTEDRKPGLATPYVTKSTI